MADATRVHEEVWPAIEAIVRAHAEWGDPVIIEGWALCPERVAAIGYDNVSAIWLTADEGFLESQTRAATGFYRGASDEESMIRKFVGRSVRYNELIVSATNDLGLVTVRVDAGISVDELAEQCIQRVAKSMGG